ncbi:MAG: deoxynucleoside kinase [Bacteroidales bacterium]|jgi:thymidylate kinase
MNKLFIIEGGNSTGKTTLIHGLQEQFDDLSTVYSIPNEYNKLRQNTYNTWSDKASLLFYLSANLEMIYKLDSNFTIFDRSIISTFSIYLSRIDEKGWNNILLLYNEFINLMPKIDKIYLLTANEDVRLKRINEKSGQDKENDLKELEFEKIKDKARIFLLEHSSLNYEIIDTSYLTKEEVLNKVCESMKNEHR